MPKASRIDPILHYSRRCRELEAERNHWKAATFYLAGLAAPYVAPNAHPEQLALEAYDKIVMDGFAANSRPENKNSITEAGDNE